MIQNVFTFTRHSTVKTTLGRQTGRGSNTLYLAAGEHRRAIQRGHWKGRRIDDWFAHTLTYTSKLRLMSAGTILNFECERKTTASQRCNYNKTVLWRKAKQVAAWFCDDDLIMDTGELCNHSDAFLLWVKVQNNEADRTGCMIGTATYWWQQGGSGGRRREVRSALTLLSSGCTLHIYKEEGACLPTQQKGWGQYTSVGQEKICKKLGLALKRELADTWVFHFHAKKENNVLPFLLISCYILLFVICFW